ncbi:DNA invertase Pin-like site-specific DNA recombinase [Bradyrhizobium sp. USDA 3397]
MLNGCKAASHGIERKDAGIVIATLDRFSRRVSFIAVFLEQGIGPVCAEMPNAADFKLHMFAALAQEERRLISERTRAALVEAKRRRKILGSNGKNFVAKNCRAADEFASQFRAKLDADLLRQSYSEIARYLNDAGITTLTGRKFYPQTVKNYLTRANGHT